MSHYGKMRKAESTPKDGERYANGKTVLPKCQCRHKDCVYRSRANGENAVGACDYIGITGHSRLLWHRLRGLSEEVKDCKLYEKRMQNAKCRMKNGRRKRNGVFNKAASTEGGTGAGLAHELGRYERMEVAGAAAAVPRTQ